MKVRPSIGCGVGQACAICGGQGELLACIHHWFSALRVQTLGIKREQSQWKDFSLSKASHSQ